LIEQAGLKGKRIGDAEVSSVHGNFLVNKGKAGYEDVIGLVRHVRNHVKKAHNLELMPEVQLLGELWDNVL
jgi:UDP-N-acetylmuramate dehydrogenase